MAVFIDYQNVYHRARACFGFDAAPSTEGQVDPRRLADVLADRAPPPRRLVAVRVYRGEPSPRLDPRAHAATQRQSACWAADHLVTVWTRPLRYTAAGPQEKGVDVLLAIDLVEAAWRDRFDVAVVASADSDLAPAVERVLDVGKGCEVAAWRAAGCRSRLAVPGRAVRCHWLDRGDFEGVADHRQYTRSPRA